MDNLKQKSIQTVRWTFMFQFLNYAISFVLSIVLARLITPEEFGLTAMISIFIALANILINSGLSSSLIRFKDSTPEDYTTVFYFNTFISFLLYGIMFFVAPSIASFYDQPDLLPITRIITLVFVINSFSVVQNAILVINLDFKKQVILNIISLFLSVIIAIVLAIKGFGVYSIVWQTLSQSTFLCILLWVTSKWKPKGGFNLNSLKKLWGFSSYILFTGIFNSIADNLDNLIIGKVFQSNSLGLFVRAKSTRAIPQNILSNVLSTTTFSILSKINDDPSKFKDKHLKFYKLTMFFLIPFTFAFFWVSEDFILFFYGDTWTKAVPLLKIISFGLIPMILGVLFSQSIMSYGDSKLQMKLSILKRTITVIALPSGLFLSINEFVFVFVISQYLGLFIDLFYVQKKIGITWIQYFQPIILPLIFSITFSFVIYIIKNLNLYEGHFINLIFDTLIVFSIYAILSFKLNKIAFLNFKEIIPIPKLGKK